MINCHMCGRLVPEFFHHIAIDCDEMDDEEVEAAMAEEERNAGVGN